MKYRLQINRKLLGLASAVKAQCRNAAKAGSVVTAARPTGTAWRATAMLALVTLLIAPLAQAGAGGSKALFSLDRASLSILGCADYSPADIFVDDPDLIPTGTIAPPCALTRALSASGLGLAATANIRDFSPGNNPSVAYIVSLTPLIPFLNPMDQPNLRYQFSVGRSSQDGIMGLIPVPHRALPKVITKTPEFEAQFAAADQAADILDNEEEPITGIRVNYLTMNQHLLKLTGSAAPPSFIDNIDGFKSTGLFGPGPLADADGKPAKPVYFVVDAATAAVLGVTTGHILVKPAGDAPIQIYATPAALGLLPGDAIDALDLHDGNANLVFDAGDGVVFSLGAGSPSLPRTYTHPVTGVVAPIGPGGLFLSLPGQPFLTGLPPAYFSLDPDDELDAVMVCDPLSEGRPPIQPLEALYFSPARRQFAPGGGGQMSLAYSHVGTVQIYSIAFALGKPGVARIRDLRPASGFRVLAKAIAADGQQAFITAVGPRTASFWEIDTELVALDLVSVAPGVTPVEIRRAQVLGERGPASSVIPSAGKVVVSETQPRPGTPDPSIPPPRPGQHEPPPAPPDPQPPQPTPGPGSGNEQDDLQRHALGLLGPAVTLWHVTPGGTVGWVPGGARVTGNSIDVRPNPGGPGHTQLLRLEFFGLDTSVAHLLHNAWVELSSNAQNSASDNGYWMNPSNLAGLVSAAGGTLNQGFFFHQKLGPTLARGVIWWNVDGLRGKVTALKFGAYCSDKHAKADTEYTVTVH